MPFAVSKILDHGTQNPIVARLTLQIFEIINQCNIAKDAREGIMDIYMNSLVKKLLRCWEIGEWYRSEFKKQIDSYKPPAAHFHAVTVPSVMRLEEESHNFLYEAKNFVRDLLKVFNFLYETQFTEASEYYRAKRGSKSVVEFAELTFGSKDPKAEFLKAVAPTVEYFVSLRNAVEHPGGYSGTLKIRNFRLDPDGKVSEPGWWREQNGNNTPPESSIGADFGNAIDTLLTLGEGIFVYWANDKLMVPKSMRIGFVPKERRDPMNPIKYVVTASEELERQIANLEVQRQSQEKICEAGNGGKHGGL